MKESILCLTMILIYSCSSDQNASEEAIAEIQTVKDSSTINVGAPDLIGDIEYRVFRTDTVLVDEASGWGYDIYVDKRRMIHQPHVPAISGNIPFQSKEMAESVAKLVIFKLSNNINPPSVSIHELDSLGFE